MVTMPSFCETHGWYSGVQYATLVGVAEVGAAGWIPLVLAFLPEYVSIVPTMKGDEVPSLPI